MTTRPEPSNQASGNPATLKGCVNTFYRHYKGKKLGPYYVRRWKVGRKVYREYIKADQVERVKAACLAYREGRKGITKFLNNFDFLGKMMGRYDYGKPVTLAMEDYNRRLRIEGMYIDGRPPLRRRVTRTIAIIDGKQMIVKTIFELDGTTKTFMVPLFTKHPMEHIKECLLKVWNEAFGAEDPPDQLLAPPKLWLPAC
jgi:hypothetical protein